MAVRKYERHETVFSTATKADDLALYTIKILGNPKAFPPGYEEITKRITDHVLAISDDVYMANIIRVNGDPELFRKRSDLQKDAIRRCRALTHLVTLAKKAFHLRTKRVRYWTGLVLELEGDLDKWKESDAKRFKRGV